MRRPNAGMTGLLAALVAMGACTFPAPDDPGVISAPTSSSSSTTTSSTASSSTTSTAPVSTSTTSSTPSTTSSTSTTVAPTSSTSTTSTSTSTTVAPPAGGVDLDGFPDASDTGVPSGTSLKSSGSLAITEDGTVVDGLLVRGQITVEADDVTIRNTRIETSGSLYGISQKTENGGLLIEDVEIYGTDGACSVGIVHGGYTARRVDVSGCEDGLRIGGNTTVEDSYIHDLRYSDGAHNDAAQSVGGSNIRLIGNTLEGRFQEQTSSILFHSHFAPMDNVRLEGNLFSGGTYTVSIKPKEDNPTPTNVEVVNNVWVRDSYKFGSHRFEVDGLTLSGNRFEDGSPYEYDTLNGS